MTIKFKGSGGSIKFSGTGGSMKLLPLAGGGGGGGLIGTTLTYGTQSFLVVPDEYHPYLVGDSVVLASSDGAVPYSLGIYDEEADDYVVSSTGNLPINLNAFGIGMEDDVVITLNDDPATSFYIFADVALPFFDYVINPDEYTKAGSAPVVTLDYGVDTITTTKWEAYPYLTDDSVVISSPAGALPYEIWNYGEYNLVVTGTLPVNLNTLDPGVIQTYTQVRIDNDNRTLFVMRSVAELPLNPAIFGAVPSDYTSNVTINGVEIYSGDAKSYSYESISPITLSTLSEDTTYSIVDSSSSPVDSGNLPLDLRTLNVAGTYTVTASGTTFTVVMSALPDISSITGKILHLDASDAGTITLSGSDVTSWEDKSAEGNDATPIIESGGSYPTYTAAGGGAVVFDSSDLTGMSTAAFQGDAMDSAKTIFFVGSNIVETNPEYVWAYGAGNGRVLSRYLSGDRALLNAPGFGGLIFDVDLLKRSSPPVLNVTRITPGTHPASAPFDDTVRMYDGSTYYDMEEVNVPSTSSTYGLHLMRPLPGATVDAGVHQTGNIHEVLAFDASLSDSDVNTVISYLKAKWGI